MPPKNRMYGNMENEMEATVRRESDRGIYRRMTADRLQSINQCRDSKGPM